MSRSDLLHSLLTQRILVLEGAMGTMIQSYKLGEADYRGERFADFAHDLKGNNDLLCLTPGTHLRWPNAADSGFKPTSNRPWLSVMKPPSVLNRLTVRAPRSGTILQINVRSGEYATLGPSEPLMLLGETEQLQVRADVDEVNAPLVTPQAGGTASIKSLADRKIPLTFVRIEPYVIPKRSLTGENTERVDTRVLQVIYRFERPSFPVYAGQQVDVFIERHPSRRTGEIPSSPVTPTEQPL